jgi:ABC-type polysaccharide/polyol phosphate transport system ATPase subunit
MTLIDVRNVSKKFSRHSAPRLIREHLKARFHREDSVHTFYALRDVSLTVNRNEGIQVFGVNGAGKSTLLNLVTGLTRPDAGVIEVKGVVGALLELGAGFHPDLTGRENLLLNAALIGISEKRAYELAAQIVEFAELEDFTEEPLRTYSAGMIMRLAFSVALNLEPDVLIIDEVLGVGDAAFQQKCYEAIRDIRKRGTSLLCVSHVTDLAEGLFERAIWLHEGAIVLDGGYGHVAAQYMAFAQSPDRHRAPRPAPEPGAVETWPPG